MNKLSLLVIVLILASCGTTKDVVYEVPFDFEEELLDTLTVSAPVWVEGEEDTFVLPPYNPEATRYYDLLHTKLEISFDWEKQRVLGKAHLDLEPFFYPINQVVLDAKQFVIHEIKMGLNGMSLMHNYDGQQLTVILDRFYKKGQKINLYIDYTAQPNEGPIGGSAAITSDKGLFFINPMNEIPGKPRQIWTQGETENNSKWFPTFDKSNERCTQEIYITVEEGLETLSNGALVSSLKNGNGTKTDYWKMDKPHAPYLFMMMIGDFARVQDSWNGKLLEYMVDPPYEAHAKEIFNHTGEMLTFFSDLLDYPYPWNKYSQVIAEDYVSGAMENTTGVIFGDFVQKTKRELIDNENDQIVAHEMFHHWFGDLVTCESWANLTLNEGFANYSEYLWYEHKYGKDDADAIRMSEMEGYFYMAQQSGTHPLIHYGFEDKEDMFDAHSYNKGGLVLHMLRHIVGDGAFFTSLNKYLKDNEFTAVETAELRMAFEETTGQDLNWFFDQWYLDQGHPIMDVTYDYADGKVMIYTSQIQNVENHRPIFILPLEAAVYDTNGNISYHSVVVDARKDTIIINGINEHPLVTVLDGKSTLLGEVREDRDSTELFALLQYSPNHFDKRIAANMLNGNPAITNVAYLLIEDNHHILRNLGVTTASMSEMDKIKSLITEDPHSSVRANALMKYSSEMGEKAAPIAELVLKNEAAYGPLKPALDIVYQYDPAKGIKYAEKMMADDSPAIIGQLAEFFAETGDAKYLNYIEDNMANIYIYQLFNVFGRYSDLLLNQDNKTILSRVGMLRSMGIENDNMYRRYLATNTLNSIKNKFSETGKAITAEGAKKENEEQVSLLGGILEEIISKEKDESLVARYRAY
jgi:aminopeptidase N